MMRNETPVPEGWQVVRLGDVACERNQRANSGPQAEVFSVTKHSGFVRSLEYFGRQVFSRDTSNYKIVRRGDLAYATIHLDEGSLGILRDSKIGMISPMYTVFEVDRTQAEPEFLFSLMKLPQMVAKYTRIGEGSVHRRKSISFENLSRLSMVIPDLAEQRRVLAVLDSIDEAIERTEAVVAATERLRDALLHELLTRGVPGWHSEWKHAPGIGTIPASWEVVRLGDVADIVMGQSPAGHRCNRAGEGTPLLNGPTEFGQVHPTPEQWTTAPAKMAYSEDLLLCVRGATAGRMNWANCNYSIGRGVAALRHVGGPRYQRYLAALMHYRMPQLLAVVTGSTFPNLSRGDVSNLLVLNPPLSEQMAIAALLGSADAALQRCSAATNALRSVEASAADTLLTGRVRAVERAGVGAGNGGSQ